LPDIAQMKKNPYTAGSKAAHEHQSTHGGTQMTDYQLVLSIKRTEALFWQGYVFQIFSRVGGDT